MPTQVPNSGYSATPFEEPIALKPFLKGIADAIREKKKTTELINAQDFRNEILSIQGGANVVKSGGTVVPNSGYVEKVYFNTKLSVEEVVNLCSLVANEYVILRTENSEGTAIYNIGVTNVDGVYGIINFASDEPPYFVGGDVGLGFVGWNPEFSGVIEINSEVVTTVGETVLGAENDKLTQLISITEGFESKVIKELSGDYEAVDIVLNELPSVWKGKEIPNDEYIENIYFNTKLSIEEVDNILSTLDYSLRPDLTYYIGMFPINENQMARLVVMNGQNYGLTGYAIRYVDIDVDKFVYVSNQTIVDFISSKLGVSANVGWLSDFNGILEINKNAIPEFADNIPATNNDKLVDLMSIEAPLENTIDLEQYLDNKQMPLSVTVNVASSGEDMLQARVDATNSCAYLFYRYIGNNVDFIKDLDTSNVTNMGGMFRDCSALETIPLLDTSNVTNMSSMFNGCSALETIPQLDMIKVTNMSQMFYNCSKLTNLTLLNIKVNLDLSQSEKLTLDSLINTVKEFINVGSARILTMGTVNLSKIANTYVKFTDSSVTTIPTNEKGDVVVCESTDTGAMLLSDYALLKNWTLA